MAQGVTAAGGVKQAIQIYMLREKNEQQKATVQKLYDSIEPAVKRGRDEYIPSGGK